MQVHFNDIINKGDYHTEARKPWSGSYATALAKSHRRHVAAGDEHSSHSDEEVISSLPTPTLSLSLSLIHI